MRRGRMNLSRRDAVVGLLAAALMPSAGIAQEGTRALTDAYNASGQDLFRSFAAKPGNIVFSPYSIGTALAMVCAGARGEIAEANAKVLAILNAYDRSKTPPLCPGNMRLVGERCEMERSSDTRCP